MKCVNCGLPLSPTRTHCPGCGMISTGEAGKQKEQSFNQAEVPQYAFPSSQGGNGFPGIPMNAEQPQWKPQSAPWQAQNAQGMPFIQQASPAYQPEGNETPLPTQFPTLASPAQAGQLILTGMGRDSQDEQTVSWKPGSRMGDASQANLGTFPQFSPPARKSAPTLAQRSTRAGFTIAGLCVFAGGLVLVFVYIISLSLPPSPLAHQDSVAVNASATAQGFSPAAQASTTNTTTKSQPTPALTPTVSLPGQSYIDTAQMASGVNTYTAQPTQTANSFKVKQQIFVTFMLHPNVGGGAVCLLWYLNQKEFSRYTFPVDTTPQSAYSFAYPGSPGPGSVEIYWASTTACTDKALAQVVNFTINP